MTLIEKFKEGIWNVGIINSTIEDVMEGKDYSVNWMKHRYKDRFFADPFLYEEDKWRYLILAEEYKFIDRHGRIVLLEIQKANMKLLSKQYIINEKFHLSYPMVQDGKIFPEAFRSGNLFSYEIKKNALFRETVIDLPLIDTTILDYNNIRWLFATTRENDEDALQKLSIFYKDGDTYKPHCCNPIKINLRTARPGGNFFKYKGNLYRPAQNCKNFYGESIVIMKVNKLSTEAFEEEEVLEVRSNSDEYKGLHTFNLASNSIIVDGYKESVVFKKIFYVKFKQICKLADREIVEGINIVCRTEK